MQAKDIKGCLGARGDSRQIIADFWICLDLVYFMFDSSLADQVMQTGGASELWLTSDATQTIGYILIAAFGIAVCFVAYKLIKRALNKA